MNKELISVIIPIYNVMNYLSYCIDSVIAQDYSNIEIILVNDGSTDKSLEICNYYKEKDNRIIVVDKKNGGLSDARNAGLEIARGKYVVFIDGDDFVSDNFVSYLYNLMVSNNADISSCKFKTVYNYDKIMHIKNEFNVILTPKESLSAMVNYDDCFLPNVCNKMFDIKLFDNVRFPTGKIYEDMIPLAKLIINSTKVVKGSEENYYYYQRAESISNRNFSLKEIDHINLSKELIEVIKIKYDELIPEFTCFYLLNAMDVCNKMIRSKKYIQNIICDVQNDIEKNKFIIKKSNLKLIKKMQLFLFKKNFKFYSLIYKIIKR